MTQENKKCCGECTAIHLTDVNSEVVYFSEPVCSNHTCPCHQVIRLNPSGKWETQEADAPSHESWEVEFDKIFGKPISDEAHRHLVSPTSKNVYYDNSDIKDFIHQQLLLQRQELAKRVGEMKKTKLEWVGTTDNEKEVMLAAYDGHNIAINQVLALLTDQGE